MYKFNFKRNKNNMINLFFKENKRYIMFFFKLGVKNFHFINYKKHFKSGFFSFFELESSIS